jgi:hypothetical protein
MSTPKTFDKADEQCERKPPAISVSDDGVLKLQIDTDCQLRNLYGVKSAAVGSGLVLSSLTALGVNGELYRDMVLALATELEPRDALEAMMVSQIAATHVAMVTVSGKAMDSSSLQADIDAMIENGLKRLLERQRERQSRRRVVCGAKTRRGQSCRMKSEPGRKRCLFHGGKSTGPKTPEGKARIAAAQRIRWARFRLNNGDEQAKQRKPTDKPNGAFIHQNARACDEVLQKRLDKQSK